MTDDNVKEGDGGKRVDNREITPPSDKRSHKVYTLTKDSQARTVKPTQSAEQSDSTATVAKSDRDGTTLESTLESTPESDSASTIAGWMIAMLWAIALTAAAFLAQNWLDERKQSRDGVLVNGEAGQAAFRISANRWGQYQAMATANGVPLRMLIDTGASGISIPASVADNLGLQAGRPFQVMTANGITTVYETTIDSLAFGPFVQNQVNAHINPTLEGQTALLGMSFLRDYKIMQRNGELTISLDTQ